MSDLETPKDGMRSRVSKGAAWTAGGQMVRMSTSLVQVIVLSRLLDPSDIGLVAMCAPIIAFVTLLQDLGLNQAAVQKEKLTYDDVNFLFWTNLLVCGLLCILMLIAAPFAASFYSDYRVAPLVCAMSLLLLLGGMGSQYSALLNRKMDFKRLAQTAAFSSICGLFVSIIAALFELGYWSIYLGSLSASLTNTCMLIKSVDWRPSPPKKVRGVRSLLSFGAGLTGFNFLNFFARNLDGILIGRYWGSNQLGQYDRANRLLLFPLTQIMGPLSQVMVPALSRLQSEPERYRGAFIKSLSAALLLVLPGVAFATGNADIIVPLLLGPKWIETSRIFSLLGFAAMLQAMNNPAGWLFISQGRTNEFFRWGLISSATVVAAFLIGLPYGPIGVASAYAVGEYIRTPLLWAYVGKRGPVTSMFFCSTILPYQLAAHAALGTIPIARYFLPNSTPTILICCFLICSTVFYAIILMTPQGRSIIKELVNTAITRGGK